MTFADWPDNIHSTKDQSKRIASAKSSATTPASIDKNQMTAIFPSTSFISYETTLKTCTCRDFTVRKLPCKHIYRLAIELGLWKEHGESGINKNLQITLEDAVAELESLNDAEQMIIKDFLYQSLYHEAIKFPVLASDSNRQLTRCILLERIMEEPSIALQVFKRNRILQILDERAISGFKRNMSLKTLIAWCIENVSNLWDVFPSIYVFKFAENFQISQRRVYSYLLRKYDWAIYYNAEMQRMRYPRGAQFGGLTISVSIEKDGHTSVNRSGNPDMCYFPDDKITQLLTIYGHNRCLNGFLPQPCD